MALPSATAYCQGRWVLDSTTDDYTMEKSYVLVHYNAKKNLMLYFFRMIQVLKSSRIIMVHHTSMLVGKQPLSMMEELPPRKFSWIVD